MYTFDIQFVNSYGHVVKDIFYKAKTEKAAITKAKKEKFCYPECYIEIINMDTMKRIYA